MSRWVLILFLGSLVQCFPGYCLAQEGEEIFVIYLVRHAEKATDPANKKDPPLSTCGTLRAETMAVMLREAELAAVYSTPYERTMATARPIAASMPLEIKVYDPWELELFAQQLRDKAENALVVGHSNTTGVLAGMLAGQQQEEFDEAIYDRLYQVIFSAGQTRMVLLHQGFRCERPS